IALEFFGEQHRQRRDSSLPHLCLVNVQSDRIICADLNICIQLSDGILCTGFVVFRQIEPENETTGCCSACLEKGTAIQLLNDARAAHSAPPVVCTFDPETYRAARWMAARIAEYVPHRHRLVCIAWSISASVGFCLRASKAEADMICPD